jgi:hypothetical protein
MRRPISRTHGPQNSSCREAMPKYDKMQAHFLRIIMFPLFKKGKFRPLLVPSDLFAGEMQSSDAVR